MKFLHTLYTFIRQFLRRQKHIVGLLLVNRLGTNKCLKQDCMLQEKNNMTSLFVKITDSEVSNLQKSSIRQSIKMYE